MGFCAEHALRKCTPIASPTILVVIVSQSMRRILRIGTCRRKSVAAHSTTAFTIGFSQHHLRKMHFAMGVEDREQLHTSPRRVYMPLPEHGSARLGRGRVVLWRVQLPWFVSYGAGGPDPMWRGVRKLCRCGNSQ